MTRPGPAGARRRSVGPAPGAQVRGAGDDRLPYRVEPAARVDLASWARANSAVLDRWLAEYGAVLFAGFATALDPDAFAAIVPALAGPAAPYRERSSPRTELAPGVYTSTEHPADQLIALHNENGYQRCLPERLVFGCVTAAATGGATPLADCARVLERLPADVVDGFRSRGVRYVRTFGHGVGLSWQETFGSADPAEVQRYCAAERIDVRWGPHGVLRTEQVRPAVLTHPGTGAPVWVNHIGLFSAACLQPELHAALVATLGPDNVPLQVYYGDGGRIDDAVLALIHDAYAAESVLRPWRPGEVLLVDNLRVAHGRTPFTGPRRILVGMAGRHCPAAGGVR